MTDRARRYRVGGMAVGMLLGLAVSGCDYWPPSLQAQIEQLRAEAQVAAAQQADLQAKLSETIKLRDELQARVDALTRQNQELTTRVADLEKTLAEREKAKAAKPAKKAPARSKPNGRMR
jgi:outer membrane murein-binding lipoprotein Lpp